MKRTGPPRRPIADRLWEKVYKSSECWIFTGTKAAHGYGIIQLPGRGGKRQQAHRISYELTYGPFDKKLFVCHKCDNPPCVRPDHLFLGTQKDNMRDCSIKNRTGKEKIAKPFIFKAPNGEIIKGRNLTQFCKDNFLNQARMWLVLNYKAQSHKGYRRHK